MKTMKHVPCYGIQLHAEHILFDIECIFFIAIASAFIKLASFCFAHVHMFDLSNWANVRISDGGAAGQKGESRLVGSVYVFCCFGVMRWNELKWWNTMAFYTNQHTQQKSSTWILWYDRRKELQQPTIQHGFVVNDFPQRMNIPIVGW